MIVKWKRMKGKKILKKICKFLALHWRNIKSIIDSIIDFYDVIYRKLYKGKAITFRPFGDVDLSPYCTGDRMVSLKLHIRTREGLNGESFIIMNSVIFYTVQLAL